MKKSIHQILSDLFEQQMNNTKKAIAAENLQRPFKQIIKTFANGNQIIANVCFN